VARILTVVAGLSASMSGTAAVLARGLTYSSRDTLQSSLTVQYHGNYQERGNSSLFEDQCSLSQAKGVHTAHSAVRRITTQANARRVIQRGNHQTFAWQPITRNQKISEAQKFKVDTQNFPSGLSDKMQKLPRS
jgi:hypothetical protein